METAQTQRRRIPGPQRRAHMVRNAIAIAQADGLDSLTLARLAQASGVTKPIAYQHFGSLEGLHRAMHEVLIAEYEGMLTQFLQVPTRDSPDVVETLRGITHGYLEIAVRQGSLFEEVGARLISPQDSADPSRLEVSHRYAGMVAGALRISDADALPGTLAFMGAADRLVEAVLANKLDAEDAADWLMRAFIPVFTEDPAAEGSADRGDRPCGPGGSSGSR